MFDHVATKIRRSEYTLLLLPLLALILIAMPFEHVYRSTLVTLIFFLAIPTGIAVKDPVHILKFIFLYYLILSNEFGVFVTETYRLTLTELGIESYYVGSLPLISCFNGIVLLTLHYFDSRISKKKNIISGSDGDRIIYAVVLITLLTLSVVLFVLASNNPFFQSGLDRFRYRDSGMVQFAQVKLQDWMMYLIPFGLAGIYLGLYRPIGLFLVLYCVSAFLIGNKFGLFLTVGQLILLSLYPKYSRMTMRSARVLLVSSATTLAAFVGIVFFFNYLNYGFSLERNASYLIQRLAQQGQLWWRTYALEVGKPGNISEFRDEIAAYFTLEKPSPISGTYGIYKVMMHDVVDQNLFVNKINSGSRYASSTPSMLYYYFRSPGLLLFAPLFTYAYSQIANGLQRCSIHGASVESFVMTRFFLLSNSVFAQSDFDILFSYKSLIWIAVLVGAWVARKRAARGLAFDPIGYELNKLSRTTKQTAQSVTGNNGEFLFVAVTPYQLLSSITVATNYATKEGCCDILVHNQFKGAHQYVEELKTQGIFRNIALVDTPVRWDSFTGLRVLAECVFAPSRIVEEYRAIVGTQMSECKYSRLYFGAGWTLTLAAKLSAGPHCKSYLIDEGSGSHVGAVAKSTVIVDDIINRQIYPLSRRDQLKYVYKRTLSTLNPDCTFNIAGIYLFNPSERAVSLYVIPVIECSMSSESKAALTTVFSDENISAYKCADCIVLGMPSTEHFDILSIEKTILQCIVDNAHGKTVVYRPHPRQKERLPKIGNLQVDESNVQWEVLCMIGVVSSDMTIISFGSTGCLSPKKMANAEPKLIYLYKLLPPSPEQEYFLIEATEALSRYFDTTKIFIPNNIDELGQFIDSQFGKSHEQR